MRTIKAKVYTGPCWVKQYADIFRNAQIQVDCEGTQHVYVTLQAIDTFDARYQIFQIAKSLSVEFLPSTYLTAA